MHFRKIFQKIPHLYFIAIWFWVALEGVLKGQLQSFYMFALCLPFAYQIAKEKKGLNLLLGILMLCWSVLMLLAYFSDLAKINEIGSQRTMRFVIGGGLLVILNFVMTINLISKAVDKSPLKSQNSPLEVV